MLKEYGDQLIHSSPVDVTIEGDHPDVSIYLRQSDDGSQFFFVRNSKPSESRSANVKVRPTAGSEQALSYDLGNFGAKVLYVPPGATDLTHGEWLPKPVERPVVAPPAPVAVPVGVTSTKAEEPSKDWRSVRPGKHLDSVGIFDPRFVHYRVNFSLSAADVEARPLLVVRSHGSGDRLTARVNGIEVPSSTDCCIALGRAAHEGNNTAEILFENLGCPNFGPVIEEGQGITQIVLAPEAGRRRVLKDWRMKPIAGDPADPVEVRADFDDRDWTPVSLSDPAARLPPGGGAVYRATLSVTKQQMRAGIALTFGTIDDGGTLYVNGQKVGSANNSFQSSTFDVTPYVREGNNTIALFAQNAGGDGGLYKGCDVDPIGRPLQDVQVSADTRVLEEEISPEAHRGLLVSYALEFELPDTGSARSVPWKLHLEADTNAFVTLNGHELGRYWAVGPQRDIWLPECWLKFGPGSKNLIELQARPTTDAPLGTIIRLGEVRPYPHYANHTKGKR
jgi:hypothetical protein